MSGTLFVVATPIGNLEDLTFRALRTLREVDLIAAEDTRRTAKLLAHYDIHKPMVSLREHNEYREAPRLVARLLRGDNIALVSDAGTPAIADPGARLVAAARDAGIIAVPIPGPSAVTAALSVAGIAVAEFVFMGFPPARGSERNAWLHRLKREPRTVVVFESPHRIAKTLLDFESILAVQPILIMREISKINYELVLWTNEKRTANIKNIGEFVIVIPPRTFADVTGVTATDAFHIFGYLIDTYGINETAARDAVGLALEISPDEADRAIRLGRKLVKKHKMSEP
jgi:16S rRNA (cytidine1402-2'-O)-methyltransferase